MPETIYYPEVRCEVREGGILPQGVTAVVEDINRRRQFVQVTQALINRIGDVSYLPIGLVEIDRKSRKALIELPAEADSGVNRMWVGFDSLRSETRSMETVA